MDRRTMIPTALPTTALLTTTTMGRQTITIPTVRPTIGLPTMTPVGRRTMIPMVLPTTTTMGRQTITTHTVRPTMTATGRRTTIPTVLPITALPTTPMDRRTTIPTVLPTTVLPTTILMDPPTRTDPLRTKLGTSHPTIALAMTPLPITIRMDRPTMIPTDPTTLALSMITSLHLTLTVMDLQALKLQVTGWTRVSASPLRRLDLTLCVSLRPICNSLH